MRELTKQQTNLVHQLVETYNSDELGRFYKAWVSFLSRDFALLWKNTKLAWTMKKLTRKRERAEAIAVLVTDRRITKAWAETLPPEARKVAEYLTWFGVTRLDILEKLTGICVYQKEKERYSSRLKLRETFQFLSLRSPYWGYTTYPERVLVSIPLPFATAMQTALPPPAGANLNPAKEKIAAAYDCNFEQEAPFEISRALGFIQQGHMPLKQNGMPRVKGIENLIKVTGMREFFPEGREEFKYLRAKVIAMVILQSWNKTQTGELPLHEIVRELFEMWQAGGFTFVATMLPHLKVKDKYALRYADNIKPILASLLKEMTPGKWYTKENLVEYTILRRPLLLEISAYELQYVCAEESDLDYEIESKERIYEWNVHFVVTAPTVQAFFFLAAALGLVEIAFGLPRNPLFRRPKHEGLTPFDGLKGVRLTELGAYVSGQTRHYEAREVKQEETTLFLDPQRLFLTLSGHDPLLELNLQKFMESVGAGRYHLTFESLFATCQSKREIRQAKKLFDRLAGGKLPSVWQDFFKRALERLQPIEQEKDLRVFKLADNSELLRIVSTDPLLSSIILKVEGRRVALKVSDLRRFRNQLKKYGYLV